MRYATVLLMFISVNVMASSRCKEAIDGVNPQIIVTSCFQVTETGLSFSDAIVYEKLKHEFGDFANPSDLFLHFEHKARTGSADFKLAFARTVELAFDPSKSKWLGRADGIISSADSDTNYEEYSAQVKQLHAKWYAEAANAGSRDAQLQFINKQVKRLAAPYSLPKPSASELKQALIYARMLAKQHEPGAAELVRQLELLVEDYSKSQLPVFTDTKSH